MSKERLPDPSIFAEPDEHASPPAPAVRASARNARYGLWLFAIYVVLYAGFILLATFRHDLMARTPLGSGVNLAILYGFGLIVAALLLALLYMYLCRGSAGGGKATAE